MSDIPTINTKKYIDELEENKDNLKKLVTKLESLVDNVEEIIPKKYDYKSRYILNDRIQTLSNFFSTILSYRSELAKQIKEQANIEKLSSDNTDDLKEAISRASVDDLKQLLGISEEKN